LKLAPYYSLLYDDIKTAKGIKKMGLLDKLREIGLELPEVAVPVGAYVPAVRIGQFVYTSGQLPMAEGKLSYTGKVGEDLSEEAAYKGAQLCALNALAAAVGAAGGADKLVRVIKVTGFVNCGPAFTNHAKVINGASDFLGKLFNEGHARAAVGVASLPLNAAVEVEIIVEVTE
jgi:enamine deaminase RidA (YjgF/YER057c/UK114 family)